MKYTDSMSGLVAVAVMIWAFCMWAYGVSVCWRVGEYFWAVVSFAFAPLGFIIGVYNWIF